MNAACRLEAELYGLRGERATVSAVLMPPQHVGLPVMVLVGGLSFLTAWTIGVHAITLAQWPFAALQVALAAAVGVAAVTLWYARRFGFQSLPDAAALPSVHVEFAKLRAQTGAHVLALILLAALFSAAALVEQASGDFTPLYAVLLVTAGYALARTFMRAAPGAAVLTFRPTRAALGGISPTAGMIVLAVLILLFYFLTSVPDADDSLYLNLAVGAKHARGAVYATDSMLGIPGLPLIKSSYRLESMQLLAAVLSDVTGLPVITIAHALIPGLLCALFAAILAVIYPVLFGHAWFAAAFMHLAWLLAMRPGLFSYGHDAITRFFHGKAFFVTAMVPLIAVLTVLSVRRSLRTLYGLLAASLVASIGLTANAVYVGPLTVALSAAPLLLPGDAARRRAALRLGIVLVYPAAAILALLLLSPPAPSEVPFDMGLGLVLQDAAGSSFALVAAMLLMFGAAAAALLERRFVPVSVGLLVALLFVFNPALWRFYGEHVTGHLNYRLLWAVPFPLLLSIASGVVWMSLPRIGRFAGAVLLGWMAAAGVAGIAWGFAPIKVPRSDYAIAREINERSPAGGLILAPEEISTWIATLEDARPVVEARGIYTPQRARFMPAGQYRDRGMLFDWVSQQPPGATTDITPYLPALRRLGVRVVVVRNPGAARRALVGDPRAVDLSQVQDIGAYQMFLIGNAPP
jgi:hypothetical protein